MENLACSGHSLQATALSNLGPEAVVATRDGAPKENLSRLILPHICGPPCYCAAWALAVTSTPSALITANVVLSVGLPRSLNDR